MRNKQLQAKVQEFLELLRTQDDNLVVAHVTRDGLYELPDFAFYLANHEGDECKGDDEVNLIVLNL